MINSSSFPKALVGGKRVGSSRSGGFKRNGNPRRLLNGKPNRVQSKGKGASRGR